ncbi:MAG: glycosyltransferase, partial [Alphaproteobacteria bacterium]|nr:glycosyltransferase [Alphaproteobacteria bacterium]
MWRGAALFDALKDAPARFDVIHHNHESLCLVAARLRRHLPLPQVMHLRTNVAAGPFARWQARTIAGAVDGIVCITENERESWLRHGLTGP